MASGPITSWQINEETMEKVTDFIFLGCKVTADGDSSYEIKRCALLGRKAMTSLDGILKSGDITLPTKVCLVKAMVFLVVAYGCSPWGGRVGHDSVTELNWNTYIYMNIFCFQLGSFSFYFQHLKEFNIWFCYCCCSPFSLETSLFCYSVCRIV